MLETPSNPISAEKEVFPDEGLATGRDLLV